MSGIRYILNGQVSDVVVVTNWRGDVEALYDLNGSLVAKYTYDAWGNQIAIRDKNGSEITSPTHIATVNPFRYRGYYLDSETSLYYLKARYYDSETHRMVNEDVLVGGNSEFQSNNLFLYCGNNPVNRLDDTGNLWKWVEKAKNKVVQTYNKCSTWVKGLFRDTAHGTIDSAVAKQVAKKLPKEKPNNAPMTFYPKGIGKAKGKLGLVPRGAYQSSKGVRAAGSAARGITKAGVLAIVMLGVDIYQDTKRFDGEDLALAIGIDTFALGLSIGIGAAITAAGAVVSAPALLVFGATIGAGFLISEGAEALKKQL